MDKDSSSNKIIEKPWAVYGWYLGSWNIGRILKYNVDSPQIQYSEGQMYPLASWDPKWVTTFKSLNEAVDHFIIHQTGIYEEIYSKEKILKELSRYFPAAIKQERQRELTSLVKLLTKINQTPDFEEEYYRHLGMQAEDETEELIKVYNNLSEEEKRKAIVLPSKGIIF